MEQTLNELIENYRYYFSKINDIKCINDEYNQNIFGKEGCRFIINSKVYSGKIISISNTGIIKLSTDSKERLNYDSRNIKVLYN